MKFLVLCTFELRRADERARQLALDTLAATGFKPVGAEQAGRRQGLPNIVIGEFRAPAAELLTQRIERDLRLHFASHGLQVDFCLRANPMRDAHDVAV